MLFLYQSHKNGLFELCIFPFMSHYRPSESIRFRRYQGQKSEHTVQRSGARFPSPLLIVLRRPLAEVSLSISAKGRPGRLNRVAGRSPVRLCSFDYLIRPLVFGLSIKTLMHVSQDGIQIERRLCDH